MFSADAWREILDEQQSAKERSINFRIHALASSLFKGASQYYGVHFNVGLPEMRVLSNLSREGQLAAHRIVELTAMDKGLVSRVLRNLVRRGLITSSAPKSDPRRRTWQLSRRGVDLVKRLQPEWRRREAIIQADLSNSEREVLATLLDRLFVASENLREDETRQLRPASRAAVNKTAAKSLPRGRVRNGRLARVASFP